MNWAWAGSIDQLWRSPGFPMWLAMAAAALFGLVVLVALLRAGKSVANAALAMIALLAIGGAATALLRNGPPEPGAAARGTGSGEVAGLMQQPALACVDDLAGETVLAACEKLLFGSPDTVAAAVSYTSRRIDRLLAAGDVATANAVMTPELDRLRRSIERDRYGLVAFVLASRDQCRPGDCAAYRSLTDHNLIAANMDEKVYEAQVQRYAPAWSTISSGAPAVGLAAPPPPLAALAPSLPTGKPTTADFPTSASIPPVNIMTPEPPAGAAPPAAAKPAVAARPAPAAAAKPAPVHSPAQPAAANAQAAAQTAPPAKKPPAPPKPKPAPAAPVQLAPAPASAEE